MKLDASSPQNLVTNPDNISAVEVSFADSAASIGKQTTLSQKQMSGKWLKSLAWWTIWSSAFALAGSVSLVAGLFAGLFAPLPASLFNPPPSKSQLPVVSDLHSQYTLAKPVNILVMGIDRVPEAADNSPQIFEGRSDSMVLVRLNPAEQNVKMLSIPRDTRVEFPGLKIAKINQANVDGGVVLAARVVSDTLNGVAVHRYLRVSTGAFRELVDRLGGVRVYVPKPMKYEDKTQKLFIDLQPGWQVLNGEQAEQFARFRQDEYGDVGRVQRQQALIKALREKLQDPATLAHIPDLMGVMQRYIDTNLTPPEILALIGFGLRLKTEQYQMVLLPGRFSSPNEYAASYWLMDAEAKDRIVKQYFGQNSPNLVTNNTFAPNKLSIAIQNASGKSELPQSLIDTLRRRGFRNVRLIRDWSESIPNTEIIAEKGDTRAAIALQRVLGFGKVEAISTGELQSDLTIRVGEDGVSAIQQLIDMEKEDKAKRRSLGET